MEHWSATSNSSGIFSRLCLGISYNCINIAEQFNCEIKTVYFRRRNWPTSSQKIVYIYGRTRELTGPYLAGISKHLRFSETKAIFEGL